MYLKNQMVVFIIMELLLNELLVDIVLLLKNGLKIKILFVGSSVNKTTMKNILNDGRDISIAKLVENTSLIIK